MKRHVASRPTSSVHLWGVFALAVFFSVMLLSWGHSSSQAGLVTSPEVAFTDASRGGLAIVPASCASSIAHWPGECTPPTSCTLSVSPTSYTAGSQSYLTVHWEAPRPPDSYDSQISNILGTVTLIGPVFSSGTLQITPPSQTTTFNYSGSYVDAYGNTLGTFSCPPVTVTVSGASNPLAINKVLLYRDPGSAVAPGDFISYRISIANNSSWQTQTNMRVDDAIPANTTLVWQGSGTSGTCTPAAGSICWNQTSAPPGWSADVEFTVRVNATVGTGVTISNTATVRSDQNSPVPSNVVSNITAICTTPIDLAIDNPLGYLSGKYTSSKQISNSYTSPICVGNTTNNSFFVPGASQEEIDAFKDTVRNRLIPGLFYTNIQ